jgi:hypothetical protein
MNVSHVTFSMHVDSSTFAPAMLPPVNGMVCTSVLNVPELGVGAACVVPAATSHAPIASRERDRQIAA